MSKYSLRKITEMIKYSPDIELIQKADMKNFEREDAQNHSPIEMPEFPHIHKALRNGYLLSAFRSDRGPSFIGLTKEDDGCVAYGEHTYVEIALSNLNDDYAAGGQYYKTTTGPNGLCSNSLAISQLPTSNLDDCLEPYCRFDVWQEDSDVVCQLYGFSEYNIPDWAKEQTRAQPGVPIQWSRLNGVTYGAVYLEDLSDSGMPGYYMGIVYARYKGVDGFQYLSTKTGRGGDFWTAMLNAFNAPEVEKNLW